MSETQTSKRGSSTLLIQLVLTVLLSAGAFVLAHRDRSPAPCGVCLPEVPAILTIADKDFKDISILENRIPQVYLQFMAPQPDGVMPLRYPLEVMRSNFTIQLPMGSTSLPMGDDTFYKDSIDSQVVFKFDQALDFIKISLPPREDGESVSEFMARARHDYEKLGASFMENTAMLEMDNMQFQHFEYVRPMRFKPDEPERDVTHFVYVGPAGLRVLILDFQTTPERYELARPLVEKIMRSIEPGASFLKQMEIEYPQKFGNDSLTAETEATP